MLQRVKLDLFIDLRCIIIFFLFLAFVACAELSENTSSFITSFEVIGKEESSTTAISANNGDLLSIKGENFSNYTAVFVNNYPCEIIHLQSNSSLITIRISDKATSGKIRIDTEKGSIFSKNDLIIKVNSIITSFEPTTVVAGDQVTLIGEHFFNVESVYIGEVNVNEFKIISDSEITMLVPSFEVSAPIKITSSGNPFATSEKLLLLSPPTVASIRPLLWTSVTNAVISGTNLNSVYKAELNGVPLVINRQLGSGEKQSNIRMLLEQKPGAEYFSGNIVLTNVAGSYTTINEVQIIEKELIADFDTQTGLYYENMSELVFTQSTQEQGFFDASYEIKYLETGFYDEAKQFLILTSKSNSIAPNQKGKWTVNKKNSVDNSVFFNRLRGGKLNTYSFSLNLFGDDVSAVNLELFAIVKNSALSPSSTLAYRYIHQKVISPGRLNRITLEFNLSDFTATDADNTKVIDVFSIQDLLGFELAIIPSTSTSQNYAIRIEDISASGPVY